VTRHATRVAVIRSCHVSQEISMIKLKTQLSVVIANRPGVLERICDLLGAQRINIEGLSAYGELEHGIIRLVTSDADHAATLLTEAGFVVTRTEIVAVRLPNRPAGLARLARRLSEHRINIDYAYGSAAAAGRMATLYLRVANPARASELLAKRGPARRSRTASAQGTKTRPSAATSRGRKRTANERRTVRRPRGQR
jgi:hypothetical protein